MRRKTLYNEARDALRLDFRYTARNLFDLEERQARADVAAARAAGWTDIDVCGIAEPAYISGLAPDGVRREVPCSGGGL